MEGIMPAVERGFTILELIVTVAIVALVVAITVPILGSVRGQGRQVRCISNSRECLQATMAYATDHDGQTPILADRSTDYTFENAGYQLAYFDQSLHWPMAMEGYLGSAGHVITQCPSSPTTYALTVDPGYAATMGGHPAGYVMPSGFWLSRAMLARPAFWEPPFQVGNRALYRGARLSDVRYASDKGLMIERWAFHRQPRTRVEELPAISLIDTPGQTGTYTVSFVDGHVATPDYESLKPGVDVHTGHDGPAVLHTRSGVFGRDR